MKFKKNLLLWNYWANLNQTLLKWFLDGPLPKICLVIQTSNQDGHQAQNRKRGDEILIVHCCFSVSQIKLSPFFRLELSPFFYIGVIYLFYIGVGVISLFYIGVTSLFYIGVISLFYIGVTSLFILELSPFFISSPGPKVHVNYCHHLASVVCRLSSVVCRLSSVVCRL